MKTYEKPKLMVLSISANDLLCSCAYPTKGDELLGMYDFNGNGYLDESDFGKTDGLFTEDADSCTKKYYGYCKFTGAMILFTS